jgi:hypothetical protein
MPKQGFMVRRDQVETFLAEKLAKLGLNQKESAEFIEFWAPRMKSKPFNFVTFLPRYMIDQMAPLEVNPKPDTIIRVLMDYQPLDLPIKVQELKISTPIRKGFVAVEWGGVLH